MDEKNIIEAVKALRDAMNASSGKVSKDAKRFCESPVFGGGVPIRKHKKESW
jgi:hypothetical protein